MVMSAVGAKADRPKSAIFKVDFSSDVTYTQLSGFTSLLTRKERGPITPVHDRDKRV